MSNFVYDNTSLAFPKTDLSPLPPGANANEYIVSTDWNTLAQATVDLRDSVRAGKYFGFVAQASDPNPTAYASSWLWVRTSDGQIIHRRPGGSSRELVDRNSDIVPSTNNSFKLGSPSFRWQEVYATDVDTTSLSSGGNQIFDFTDLIGTGLVSLFHILPPTNNTKNLGSSSKQWATGYFGTAAAGVLSLTQDLSNANYVLLGPGQSAAISASNTARLRYNLTGQSVQISINGGSYLDVLLGSVQSYNTVQTNGSAVTQRSILNFSTAFTVTDGSSKTNVGLDYSQNATWTGLHVHNPGTSPAEAVKLAQVAPVSSGFNGSHALVLEAGYFDSAGHTRDWRLRVNAGTNPADSIFSIGTRIDSGSYTETFSIRTEDNVYIFRNIGASGVSGDIDFHPTTSSSDTTGYIEIPKGDTAAVSASTKARLRYNAAGGAIQVSMNGAAYTSLGGAAIGLPVVGGTSGSVPYIDGSTNLAQDNTKFFWESASKALFVGSNDGSVGSAIYGDGHLALIGTGSNTSYLHMANGQSASVSGSGVGRLRYNSTTNTFQISQNGAAYVDVATSDLLAGSSWKAPVVVAIPDGPDLTSELHNGTTWNGVTVATGDRVLLTGQTPASDNGIYIVPVSGVASRSTDANTAAKLLGAVIPIMQGTANADTFFICTNDSITLGSTSLSFVNLKTSLGLGSLAFVSNLTGIVTSVGAATSIANGALSLAKLASGTAGNVLVYNSSGVVDVAATGTAGQILTSNGAGNAPTFQNVAGGGDALTSGTLAQFAATTSLQLKGVISDETGSGALVFATSPTLVTPTLGVATATSINKVTITAPATGSTLIIQDGFTLTVSGSAVISGTPGLVSGTLAQFAATTSAQLAGVISDETGSGALVFATSPTLVTPTLGAAAATSINKVAITAPASGSTLTIQDGFTLTVSGNANVSGTNTGDVANTAVTTGTLAQFAATTSAQLAGVISDETGSGALVFATSPTLVTPTLGVASVTTINKVTITAPASSATITVADGKTLTVSNNATVSGTNTGDQTVSTMGASGALTDGTGTLLLGHGGTGATTSIGAADALSAKSSNIASASTTDLSTATGTLAHITGTTTITAFGTVAAGAERVLVFDGVLTLTHNATSLILPGGANIVTAAGDMAVVRSEGSGNWRCIGYVRAANAPQSTGSASWGGSVITAAGSAFLVDLAPTGYLDCLMITITGSTTTTIVGIAGGVDGRILIVRNGMSGSTNMQLIVEAPSVGWGSVANHIANPNNPGVEGDYVFPGLPGSSYIMRYNGSTSRWDLLATPAIPPSGAVGEVQFSYFGTQFANGTGIWGSTGINAYTHGQQNSMVGGGYETLGRFQECKGADVASANEMTLPGWGSAGFGATNVGQDGNFHKVTGTTTVKGIDTTGWQAGSRIRLTFDSTIIIQDGFSPTAPKKTIRTRTGSNLEKQAGEFLDLLYDGTAWYEVN